MHSSVDLLYLCSKKEEHALYSTFRISSLICCKFYFTMYPIITLKPCTSIILLYYFALFIPLLNPNRFTLLSLILFFLTLFLSISSLLLDKILIVTVNKPLKYTTHVVLACPSCLHLAVFI